MIVNAMPVAGEGEQLAPPGHEAQSGLIKTNHALRTALLRQLAARVRTMDLEVAPRTAV